MTLLTTLFFGEAAAFSMFTGYYATADKAAQSCSGNVCPANQIASNMPGYYCAQYQSTNPFTHMHAMCQPDGTWTKTAFPSSCDFYNRYQCWLPSNNCANSLSADCSRWCTCQDSALGATQYGSPPLGHASGGTYCPWWLPQAQPQLSHGSQGYTCWQPHAFCAYPKYGMNFVCTGYGGYWELQGGPTPTPKPVPSPATCPQWWNIHDGNRCHKNNMFCPYPAYNENFVCSNGRWRLQGNPTPKPVPSPATCPDGWNIWDGKSCYSPNMFCPYPDYNENYVCSSGKWKKQGSPTPKPTAPPVNSVNCPPSNYPPTVGDYCTTPSQICDYGSNGKFQCNGTSGKWVRM